MSRRTHRRPIIGRLTWGWIGFAGFCACAVLILLAMSFGPKRPGQVKLAVNSGVERLAPPEPLRLSVPGSTELPKTEENGVAPFATGTTIASVSLENETVPDVTSDRATEWPEPEKPVGNVASKVENAASSSGASAPLSSSLSRSTSLSSRFIDLSKLPDTGPASSGELVIRIDGQNIDEKKPVSSSKQNQVPVKPISDPTPAFLQSSPFGPIPRIAANGQLPAKTFRSENRLEAKGKGSLGIMITGLGLDVPLTERVIAELPAAVTLSFVPYGEEVDRLMQQARLSGHEVVLELPMEGYGARDQRHILGRAGLLSTYPPADNIKRLNWLLSRGKGYFAVTNYQGAKFVTRPQSIDPILTRIGQLGLTYLDDTGALEPSRNSSLGSGIRPHHRLDAQQRFGTFDVVLPAADREDTVFRERLKQLPARVNEYGQLLVKAPASANAVTALSEMLELSAGTDVTLAPVSALL